MSPELVLDMGRQALFITMLLAGPLLLAALVTGLLIGIVQAATQIQEMTLSFIPKLMALVAALSFAGAWMLGALVDFTQRLYTQIPGLLG
jgi:flagellar biosynthetic protein FliQ